jgi:subtilisin family serine protease
MRANGVKLLAAMLAVTAACVAMTSGSQASPRVPLRAPGAPAAAPGELLVRFRAGTSAASQARALAAHRAVRQLRLPRQGLQLVRLPRGSSARTVAAALEREAGVLYAEPNFVYRPDATPNDAFFADLWGLSAIQAPLAWDTTIGSPGVKVAVVDSGIAYDHSDLAPNIWTNPGESGGGKETNGIDDDGDGYVDDVHGWDFVQNDNEPLDFYFHGTHVAGTIGAAGNNGVGITGVDWETSLMALRAGDAANGELLDSNIISSFVYACAHGARVVNASFGGPEYSQAMLDVIASPGCANTLFVASAGNDAIDVDASPSYPCSFAVANLVCVTASGVDGSLASFSNYGPGSVDLAAPGVDVLSTIPTFQSVFDDDFESSIASTWTVGGTSPQWARQSDGAGGFVLSDSPAGDYAPNANTWARPTNAIDLSGKHGCAVEYDLTLDTQQDHDLLVVEGSTDLTAWAPVATYSGSIDGESQFDDLSAFDGTTTFYLRFRLQSDADATAGDGAKIDDLALSCLGTSFSDSDYFSLSGTSMAAPHVSGVAALLWSAVPSAPVSEVKAELLQGADPTASLNGRVATGELDAAGAVGLAKSPLPETTVLAGPPSLTRYRSSPFSFGGGGSVGASSFEWSLDGGAWTLDKSTAADLVVGTGTHTLLVRARDGLGRVDPTPASWTWTVDDVPPTARITAGPKAGAFAHVATATFAFTSDDPAAHFQCTVDDPYRLHLKPCTSPYTLRNLRNDVHNFAVFAVDAIGNESQPAGRVWVVDTRRCVVPNVKKKRLAKARAAIVRGHCSVGKVTRAYARARAGIVIGQKPAPRARLAKGAKVRLVVSRGPRRRH